MRIIILAFIISISLHFFLFNTYKNEGLKEKKELIEKKSNVKFVKYLITEDDGDISPEGMKFVNASNSPTGNPLLMVAYEISGTTAVYEIK